MRLLALLLLVACSTPCQRGVEYCPGDNPQGYIPASQQGGPNVTITVNPGNTPPQSVTIPLTPAELREIENDHPFAKSGGGVMFAHIVNVNLGIVP